MKAVALTAGAVVPLVASTWLWPSDPAALLWLVGLALLWRSPYWGGRQKRVATLATAVFPVGAVLWMTGRLPRDLDQGESLLATLLVLAVPLSTGLYLLCTIKTGRRPA